MPERLTPDDLDRMEADASVARQSTFAIVEGPANAERATAFLPADVELLAAEVRASWADLAAEQEKAAHLRQEADYCARFICPKCGTCEPQQVTTQKTCAWCGSTLQRNPDPYDRLQADLTAEQVLRMAFERAAAALEVERDGLRAQLPEGMKHCTILAKQCAKGHSWLTATNWVPFDCPTCQVEEAAAAEREAIAALIRARGAAP